MTKHTTSSKRDDAALATNRKPLKRSQVGDAILQPQLPQRWSLPLAADSDDLVAAETIREFSARDSKDTRVLLAYIMTLKQYDPLREYAAREAVAALGKLGPAAERAVRFLEILAENESVPDGFRKEIEVALQKIR